MSQEKNIATARRWYEEMWSLPAPEVADEIIHPEYDPDWVSIPKKGPEQVKHEIKYFRSVFPDLQYKVVQISGDGEKVWVRYQASGTQSGSAWGFDPTGKTVTFEGAAILTFDKNGMIIDRWGAFCFYDLLQDLGIVPPLWELKGRLQA